MYDDDDGDGGGGDGGGGDGGGGDGDNGDDENDGTSGDENPDQNSSISQQGIELAYNSVDAVNLSFTATDVGTITINLTDLFPDHTSPWPDNNNDSSTSPIDQPDSLYGSAFSGQPPDTNPSINTSTAIGSPGLASAPQTNPGIWQSQAPLSSTNFDLLTSYLAPALSSGAFELTNSTTAGSGGWLIQVSYFNVVGATLNIMPTYGSSWSDKWSVGWGAGFGGRSVSFSYASDISSYANSNVSYDVTTPIGIGPLGLGANIYDGHVDPMVGIPRSLGASVTWSSEYLQRQGSETLRNIDTTINNVNMNLMDYYNPLNPGYGF